MDTNNQLRLFIKYGENTLFSINLTEYDQCAAAGILRSCTRTFITPIVTSQQT